MRWTQLGRAICAHSVRRRLRLRRRRRASAARRSRLRPGRAKYAPPPERLVVTRPLLARGELLLEPVEAAQPAPEVVDHVDERRLARARHDRAAVLERAVVAEDDVQHGLRQLGREARRAARSRGGPCSSRAGSRRTAGPGRTSRSRRPGPRRPRACRCRAAARRSPRRRGRCRGRWPRSRSPPGRRSGSARAGRGDRPGGSAWPRARPGSSPTSASLRRTPARAAAAGAGSGPWPTSSRRSASIWTGARAGPSSRSSSRVLVLARRRGPSRRRAGARTAVNGERPVTNTISPRRHSSRAPSTRPDAPPARCPSGHRASASGTRRRRALRTSTSRTNSACATSHPSANSRTFIAPRR